MATIASSLLIIAAVAWCYSGDLARLSVRWMSPDYHHGFLVIPFSCYLAWIRREMVVGQTLKGSFWGIVFVAVAVAMQCFSAYISDPILAPLSIVPCLAGIALLMGGPRAIGWLWPSLLMLGFMIPLPNFMDSWGTLAMQRISTTASTFVLQTLGVPAVAYGNVIVMTNTELGVEEACSGLRSAMLFLAVCVGASLMIKGTPERIVLALGAIPAAIVANVMRIVLTGLIYQYSSHKLAEAVFHDFFGYLMFPLATGMAWGLLRLTQAVFVTVDEQSPVRLSSTN